MCPISLAESEICKLSPEEFCVDALIRPLHVVGGHEEGVGGVGGQGGPLVRHVRTACKVSVPLQVSIATQATNVVTFAVKRSRHDGDKSSVRVGTTVQTANAQSCTDCVEQITLARHLFCLYLPHCRPFHIIVEGSSCII